MGYVYHKALTENKQLFSVLCEDIISHTHLNTLQGYGSENLKHGYCQPTACNP